jgi:hypothetical protein
VLIVEPSEPTTPGMAEVDRSGNKRSSTTKLTH